MGIHTPKKTEKALKKINAEVVGMRFIDSSWKNDEMDSISNNSPVIEDYIQIYIPRKGFDFPNYLVEIGEYADAFVQKEFSKLKEVIEFLNGPSKYYIGKGHEGMNAERNVGITSALLSHHLFDKAYERSNGGVMEVVGTLTDAAIEFISDHMEVEEKGEWEEFCAEKGYSDWEEYLVATVEKKLGL